MKEQYSFKDVKDSRTGVLYLVPTPIGNLEDMTFRSVKTLQEVDLIASEDTRHTIKLLNHFDIKKPQISLHEHNYKEKIPYLIDVLKSGESIAQVSDAGMPSISDPGHELVVSCIEEDIPVIALPGANAALTALIASGVIPQPFYFYGFLPRKKTQQEAVLQSLKSYEAALLFYESPHRVKKVLETMRTIFSGKRQVVIARELTKKYEHYIRGTLDEVRGFLETFELKGEICLIVQGKLADESLPIEEATEMPTDLSIQELVDWWQDVYQTSAKEAIKAIAKQQGLSKQAVYKAYHNKE